MSTSHRDRGARWKRLFGATCLTSIALLASCTEEGDAASPPPPTAMSAPLAFSGAVGHGAASKGGRGGQVIAVTTLADSGVGSLRHCIDAAGPRICVFRVSGIIRFTSRTPVVHNPYLTIAGHTAPGGGITLAHSGGAFGRTPLIIKNTHDVVVRHIRVRLDRAGANPKSEDAFTIEGSENVILDHVSGSWARDELVNGYGDNDRITISNSIFAEGIPPHDKCALLASDPQGPQRLSFVGNLCAHNGDRNPEIDFPQGSCVEVINNVLFNAQSQFAEVWEKFGGTPVSIVGNSFKSGSSSNKNTIGVARNLTGSIGVAKVYLWDNQFDGNFVHLSPLIDPVTVDRPPCNLTLKPLPATVAYDSVLQKAGALPRDAIDAEAVHDVRSRSGRITKQPGTLAAAAPAAPYADADNDGMDDRWEASNGTQVGRSDAWGDADGDGVDNLDEFLDALHRRLVLAAVS